MHGLLVFSFSEEAGRLEVFGTAKGLNKWKEKLSSLGKSNKPIELVPPYIQSFPSLDDEYHRNMEFKYVRAANVSLNFVPSNEYILTFEWNAQNNRLEIYASGPGLEVLLTELSNLIGDEAKADCVDHDHWMAWEKLALEEGEYFNPYILSESKQGQDTRLIGYIKPYIMPREHFAKMYQLDYFQYC
ncbi:MAG: hypothetical protein ACI9S8_003125 [Chlamydiales bacterium]|jgi:hypothetical protein